MPEENPYLPLLLPDLATPTLLDARNWYEELRTLVVLGADGAVAARIGEQIDAARKAVQAEVRRRGEGNVA